MNISTITPKEKFNLKNCVEKHSFNGVLVIYSILVLLFCYISFVAYYPFHIFELVEPIKFTAPVYAGETAEYTIHYKKNINAEAEVSRQLINGHSIGYSEVTVNNPVGEHTRKAYLDIPNYAHPGTYKVVWTAKYHLHFPFYTREIKYRYESEPFQIYYRSGKVYPTRYI